MLNELHQVVTALDGRGVPIIVPHAAVEPMGKRELLLIELDSHANPQRLKLLPKEAAGTFLRIAHGSEGSSFPGFNLPLPLRVLPKTTPPQTEATRRSATQQGVRGGTGG